VNLKPTIVAVVLAIIGVVGAVVLYSSEPGGSGGVLVVLPGAASIPVDAVNRIAVGRADQDAMVFERKGDAWMQVEPLQFPMDAFSIRRLIIEATAVEVVRVLAPGEAATKDLGLAEPRAEVTWTWPDGSYTLAFGHRTVAGRSYLRPAGDQNVYVVTGDLYERAVEMNPKEWRDRTIFAPLPAQIAAIEIDDGDRRVVIEKRRKRWFMTEPVRTRVDAAAAEALVSGILRARSAGFILDQPADLSRFGLAEPSGTLTVRSQRQVAQGDRVLTVAETARLLVGSRTGVGSEDRFGMVEGRAAVVRLPEAVIAAFFPQAVRLVDPTASGVQPADVKAIVIRHGDGELKLRRELERWTAPDLGADADPAVVESLLELLSTARAMDVQIVDMPLYEVTGRTITLYGFDGKPMETIRFAASPSSARPGIALDNGDNVWRIFPETTHIPLTREDFGIGG
jgi:hypothetical protein